MTSVMLKYCGIKCFKDLRRVSQSRASFIGFIFTKESKRFVRPEHVGQWLVKIPDLRQKIVGVTVNATKDTLTTIMNEVKPSVLQLHGDESPEYCQYVKEQWDVDVWKALHHDDRTETSIEDYSNSVDGFVIDTKQTKQRGGTGVTFDWTSVPAYTRLAESNDKKLLIAGGVRPNNIAKLLAYQPPGIDIASGIEDGGQKSAKLMAEIERRVVNE